MSGKIVESRDIQDTVTEEDDDNNNNIFNANDDEQFNKTVKGLAKLSIKKGEAVELEEEDGGGDDDDDYEENGELEEDFNYDSPLDEFDQILRLENVLSS